MGNCLFLRARGWRIDRQVRKKLQIPGGMPGGGMVTGRIEPCIIKKSTGQNNRHAILLADCTGEWVRDAVLKLLILFKGTLKSKIEETLATFS